MKRNHGAAGAEVNLNVDDYLAAFVKDSNKHTNQLGFFLHPQFKRVLVISGEILLMREVGKILKKVGVQYLNGHMPLHHIYMGRPVKINVDEALYESGKLYVLQEALLNLLKESPENKYQS